MRGEITPTLRVERRSAFFTWLYRLVKNQCLDVLRRDGARCVRRRLDTGQRRRQQLVRAVQPERRHAQPLFGDVVRYELLCRRHYSSGELGA